MGGVVSSADASPVIRKGPLPNSVNEARAAPDGAAVLAVSADGGKTWQRLHPRGLPDDSVQALAIDPSDASDVYALLNNGASTARLMPPSRSSSCPRRSA